MKQIKAKMYPDVLDDQGNAKIIPMRPSLTAVTDKKEFSGTDETGEYVVIDLIVGEETYFEYDAETKTEKEVGETEWKN